MLHVASSGLSSLCGIGSSAEVLKPDVPLVFALEPGLCILSGLDESERLRVWNIPRMCLMFSLLSSLWTLIRSAVNSRIDRITAGAPSFLGNHQVERSAIHKGSSLSLTDAGNTYLIIKLKQSTCEI
jgi:hypothetical protein